MYGSWRISSLMDPSLKILAFDASPPCDNALYRKIVMSLIWMVSFSVGIVRVLFQLIFASPIFKLPVCFVIS